MSESRLDSDLRVFAMELTRARCQIPARAMSPLSDLTYIDLVSRIFQGSLCEPYLVAAELCTGLIARGVHSAGRIYVFIH